MHGLLLTAFVTAILFLPRVNQPARSAAPSALDARDDAAAYAIYTAALLEAWKDQRGTVLLQRETETVMFGCSGFLPSLTGEWADAGADFQRQNTRARMLQPALVERQ